MLDGGKTMARLDPKTFSGTRQSAYEIARETSSYPLAIALADDEGKPLAGSNGYVLHFSEDDTPPVEAFWSLTLYDREGFQVPNSINRFALSSWMPLKRNADASLDLYIQRENPGAGKDANWLPAPKGPISLVLHLYVPRPDALNGRWKPPVVKRIAAERKNGIPSSDFLAVRAR
jgi:hypothetical protein